MLEVHFKQSLGDHQVGFQLKQQNKWWIAIKST
jgi:hypothetical protein